MVLVDKNLGKNPAIMRGKSANISKTRLNTEAQGKRGREHNYRQKIYRCLALALHFLHVSKHNKSKGFRG